MTSLHWFEKIPDTLDVEFGVAYDNVLKGILGNFIITTALEFVQIGCREMFVTRCCGCKRYKNKEGKWVRLISLPNNTIFSDGICIPCIRSLYSPEIADRIAARLEAEEDREEAES